MTHPETMWEESPRLRPYASAHFGEILQIDKMFEEMQFEMEVEGNVLPFEASNHAIEQLICWDGVPDDPAAVPTFTQKNEPGGSKFALSSAWRSSEGREGFSSMDPARLGERHWREVLGI